MFGVAADIREWDRRTARLAAAIGEFDRSGQWAVEGYVSVQAWLRDQGLSPQRVRFLLDAARRVAAWPALAEAWQAGELSEGQVTAIVRNVPERHKELFAEHEASVIPTLVGLSVNDTARVMQRWSANADALDDDDVESPEPERELHVSKTLDGRHVLDGSFDAEGGMVVAHAIEVAKDRTDFDRPAAQRRADALVSVCRFFLDHHDQPLLGKRNRPHVSIVIDAGKVRALDGSIDKTAVARVLCDSTVSRVVAERVANAPSQTVDFGRSVRVVPRPLWEAVALRDRQCRFPGCDRPPAWTEAHHVKWFRHGGTTSLDNLVLLCSRHHHYVHRTKGLTAKLQPDGTFTITWPDGTEKHTRPPP